MSNYLMDGYYRETAAEARTSERVTFIKKTYGLVALSFVVFVGLLALLVKTGIGLDIAKVLFGSPISLLVLLALFIGTGYLARYLARSETSVAAQFLGLGLYVVVQAIFFLPLILICNLAGPKFADIPMQAGLLTLIVVGGLTATVFISKKDFSFLGGILCTLCWVAIGVIILAIIFGFSLGVWFSAAMIAVACGCILYDTSNILHHYPTNAHVPAALELFASIAFLLYYVMRLMIQLVYSSE